jgi:endonuclease G
MKKLSYLFLLLVGIWLAGCDDSSEASLIPEIIPTEQGSDTYVMKGYESSDNGFNVYKPKAIGTPFYIQSKAFTGRTHLLLLIVSRWKGLLLFRLPMLSAKALR